MSLLVMVACSNDDDPLYREAAGGREQVGGGGAGGDVRGGAGGELSGAQLAARLEAFRDALEAADAAGNLVVDIATVAGEVLVELEDGSTLRAPESVVIEVLERPGAWRVDVTLADDSMVSVAAVGEDLPFEIEDVEVDPYGTAPLVARLRFTSPVPGRCQVRVAGQDGKASDFVGALTPYTQDHQLAILGLYSGYRNEVEIRFLSEDGIRRLSKTLTVPVDPLEDRFPTFVVDTAYDHDPPRNLTFMVNYPLLGHAFFADAFGKMRYVLAVDKNRKHGVARLRNGNLVYGDRETDEVCEYSWLGQRRGVWRVPEGYQEIHHDTYEKPNGNFLITVNESGAATIEDIILELDRETGDLVRVWDLKESLQQDRRAYLNDDVDWVHSNGVVFDESDRSIIVSGRHQGVFKLTNDNELVWILAPTRGWNDVFRPYVLQLEPGSEPVWAQHSPQLLPNGNVLVFDNGVGRNFDGSVEYSRIVEYEIDAHPGGGGVAREVFEYGADRADLYSPIMSDADYYPEDGHRLMTSGSVAADVVYGGPDEYRLSWDPSQVERARLVEVDGAGKEVFEMVVNNENWPRGGVFRAERMVLEF